MNPTPFSGRQIGRRALVTGAASGLGFEVAATPARARLWQESERLRGVSWPI